MYSLFELFPQKSPSELFPLTIFSGCQIIPEGSRACRGINKMLSLIKRSFRFDLYRIFRDKECLELLKHNKEYGK